MLAARSADIPGGWTDLRFLLGCKVGDLLQLGDVEWDGGGPVSAMFVDESLELLLPATDDDNTGSFFNDPLGQCFSDPACRPDDEHSFIRKRHRRCSRGRLWGLMCQHWPLSYQQRMTVRALRWGRW